MRCFTILVTITTLATQAFAGAHSEEDFEKKKANHADVVSEARESLLKAFDDKIQVARKQKGANAEGRIKATEALEAEQKTFRESGGIPFSPAMRDDAVKYLKTVNQSATALFKLYEKKILTATRDGDDRLAKKLIKERERLILVVGRWECQGTNFRRGEKFHWVLFSDFTVNRKNDANDALPKGWSFQPKGGLLIRNFSPGAPKGGYKDACAVSWDGQMFEAKNQLGGVYTGRLE